jgi:hypothetical protein
MIQQGEGRGWAREKKMMKKGRGKREERRRGNPHILIFFFKE